MKQPPIKQLSSPKQVVECVMCKIKLERGREAEAELAKWRLVKRRESLWNGSTHLGWCPFCAAKYDVS